ncbi:hypothetical protein DD238_008123 [Peronospora effusa]|uniref:Reverse transcriptase domain-containing protein n=1 Tax=Peronospora effusa TaxID=542832 RepID=A0A3M6V7R0_9STRA|nr:hypothetical protein DD238_008123 [Peronospora effusa]RQM10885.1 hypothetical protein DD237_008604 [Peronospora effusa]
MPETGVQLSSVDRPGAAAYADDLKIFSSTVDGIKLQHSVVQDFMRWTGMSSNPSKCNTLSVQRDSRGLHPLRPWIEAGWHPDPCPQRVGLVQVLGDRGWIRPRATTR